MKKQYKKFALIGTSCVGKTTLLFQLEKSLQDTYKEKLLAVVPEAARYYFENKNAKNPFLYFHQKRIQNLAKRLEQQAEKVKPDIIICDRSVVDAIAYIKALGSQNEIDKLIDNSRIWLNSYTHFFLLDPIGVNYKKDLTRREEEKTRNKFHIAFIDILHNLVLPHTLISGTEQERLNKVKYIISTHI